MSGQLGDTTCAPAKPWEKGKQNPEITKIFAKLEQTSKHKTSWFNTHLSCLQYLVAEIQRVEISTLFKKTVNCPKIVDVIFELIFTYFFIFFQTVNTLKIILKNYNEIVMRQFVLVQKSTTLRGTTFFSKLQSPFKRQHKTKTCAVLLQQTSTRQSCLQRVAGGGRWQW